MDQEEFPIVEVLGCLEESVDRVRSLRERNGYVPVPGYRVYNEWVRMQWEDAHPVDSLCFFSYELAAAQLAAAEDHIQAIGKLLLEGTATVAPFVLARAAIEACGRAGILLDPSRSKRERAVSAIIKRLHELRQLRRLMVAHDPHGRSEKVTRDLRQVDEALAHIERHFREHRVALPRRPSFTQAVKSALSFNDATDSFTTLAVTAYSAVAHAVPDMLVAHTVDTDDPRWEPFNVGLVDLEEKFLIDLVIAVLLAYSRPVRMQIEAYGWPPSSWKRWLAHVRAVLRRANRNVYALGLVGVEPSQRATAPSPPLQPFRRPRPRSGHLPSG